MPTTDAGDVHRDTLALIEAVHRQDLEGAEVILDHADCKLVACFAARIAADLVEDWIADDVEDSDRVLTRMREHYAP